MDQLSGTAMIPSVSCLKESSSQCEPAELSRECIVLARYQIFRNALRRDILKQDLAYLAMRMRDFTPKIGAKDT